MKGGDKKPPQATTKFGRMSIPGEICFKVIPEFCIAHSYCMRTIFASSARSHERVRVQNIRDFPQTKLDSEIKAPFLLHEQGEHTFYFINSMRTISAITEKKFGRNLWLLFWQIK